MGKGAIIAIILAAVIVIVSVGVVAGTLISPQNAVNSVDDILLPEMPDLDIDTDGLLTKEELGLDGFEISFGTVDNDVYTNSFANLSFHTPSKDWVFMSKEEIFNHYAETGFDVTIDDATKETYYMSSDGKVYYDMFMYNVNNEQNIQVMLVDCADDINITLNNYFDSMIDEMKPLYDDVTTENAGIVTLGDNVYSVKKIVLSIMEDENTGYNILQHYALTKIGNDFVIICITDDDWDNDDGFLNIFESIVE